MKYVFTFASADGPAVRFFSEPMALLTYLVGWTEKGAEIVGFSESGIWGFKA